MPSSMTHTYFGLDVYKELKLNYQNKIKDNLEYFKLFCQGSDPFMFYHFLVGKKARKMAEIQKIMHCTKTQAFFLVTIKYIHKNKLHNNSEVMAYLYGYICHYYLDLITHPFIYCKGGIFDRQDKSTYKYNGLHQEIEYAIDLYFIAKLEDGKANKFKVHKGIFEVKELTPELKGIIKASIGDVYSIKGASKIYEKAIWYMVNFFRLANYDPYKVKLKIYSLIDKIMPDNIIKVSELSFSNEYKDINKYMNLDNRIWYLPWDKSKSYTSSFLDLYNEALNKSVNTIEEVTKMLDKNKLDDKKLKLLFQDLSFKTGLKCNEKVEFKYFEF